jgi:Tfp pilus assembly protein PilV
MLKAYRGQTLIEVLLTLALMAGGVIALIRFQNYLTYNFSLTENKTDATLLAIKQIEQLRDFQVINNQSGYTSYVAITSGSATTTLNHVSYTITWTVTSNANPDYKNIDVTVSWTDRRQSSHSVQLVTDIARVEPGNSATIM